MFQEVNGPVYLAGKEKAIARGFFGDTVNPEIILLFINRGGLKYYINYENILMDKNEMTKISVRKVL